MPWQKTAADRQRDAAVYGPEYVRNRAAARRRAAGTCEGCKHRHPRLQCDHRIPVTQHGTHALANLQMLCVGAGSCQCHEKKTAAEGGGYRAASDPSPASRTEW